MSAFSAILLAAIVSAAATTLCVAVIFLALGHVQNDRSRCFLDNPGRECALVWEVVP